MRILLCGAYPYINQNIWGGVEAVLKNLATGINLYEPQLDVKITSGNKKVNGIYERYGNIIYIKQPKFSFGSVFLSPYPWRIKKILKSEEYNIIHAHSIDFGYYGLEKRDKLIFTLHGITWEEKKYLPKYKQIGWHIFYVKRLKKILKKIRYFVSISPYARKMVEDKTNATIFDICNPVEDKFFEIKGKSPQGRILYIGVISRRKNLLALVKAIRLVRKEIHDFKLVIVGKIEDKQYFKYITDYIQKHNLEKNVEYLGRIDDDKKLEEFYKMDFLVLPSFQETAPLVISEAFAAGKPVIASNIGGIPYMVRDGKNGFLINPERIEDIANKIIYLLENPKDIGLMGKNARQYALKHHQLKKVVKKHKKMYEEVEG